MKKTRREFLKTTALGTAATLASPLFAGQKSTAGEDYKAIVCILLEGGADSVNMVVPKESLDHYLAYAKARPKSAVSREEVRFLKESDFGFHPKMARMQRLYNYNKLAVVANVGVLTRPLSLKEIRQAKTPEDIADAPAPLFCHVSQRDLWMQGAQGRGWAAEVANKVGGDFVNISVGGYNTMQEGGAQRTWIAHDDIFGTDMAMQKVRKAPVDTFFDADESVEGKSLGEQLEMVLDLMEHRKRGNFPKRQIYFVSDGGWDLHANDSDTNLRFAQKVANLDKSLGEFSNALEKLGLDEKVTTFTMSDFGRTIGEYGQDHGWGGHAFVMGGAVKRGIYGKMPYIGKRSSDALANGALIPTISSEQYLATLVDWLGDGRIALDEIFPNLANFSTRKLNFFA